MAEDTGDVAGPRAVPYVRRPPVPVTVAYRMGYVATLAVNDRQGDVITSIRVTATAAEGSTTLMERLGAELAHWLGQRPKLPIVVVQDGAPELWNLMDEWLDNFGVRPAMRLIDHYHVDERLGQVAEAIERDPHARTQLLEDWRHALYRSDRAVYRICRDLEKALYGERPDWSAPWPVLRVVLGGQNAKIVQDNLGYFHRHASKMRYATARGRGFPVGSGVTEGACKSVFAVRLKRSGQRWREHGASPCLHMRTLHLNNRLRPALQLYAEQIRSQLVIN